MRQFLSEQLFVRRGGACPLPRARIKPTGGRKALPYGDRYSQRRLRSFGRCRSLKDNRAGLVSTLDPYGASSSTATRSPFPSLGKATLRSVLDILCVG